MAKIKITKETHINWYKLMQLIRKFEERCIPIYGTKITGFCHLYNGQEAILAGTYSVITKDDKVITAYRDHGHALASGMSANSIMAELFGKATGCSRGKGGSMHMFSKEHNFFGGHGIVGAQIPLGAGMAFAEKYNGTTNLSVCYMGDGAVRQGALHEAFNMAMLWKLPAIFVIENNNYAMGTSVERTTNVLDLAKIGLSYDMPSESVDGMDPKAVHEAMNRAADRARAGDGPTLLEIETYRYRGHSMSDAAKYRTQEELDAYKKLDPIAVTRQLILDKKYLTEEQLSEIDAEVKTTVADALAFAESSPFPSPEALFEDNYLQADYPFIMD